MTWIHGIPTPRSKQTWLSRQRQTEQVRHRRARSSVRVATRVDQSVGTSRTRFDGVVGALESSALRVPCVLVTTVDHAPRAPRGNRSLSWIARRAAISMSEARRKPVSTRVDRQRIRGRRGHSASGGLSTAPRQCEVSVAATRMPHGPSLSPSSRSPARNGSIQLAHRTVAE